MPSLAGPKRPQDRVSLTDAKESFRGALADYVDTSGDQDGYDEAVAETFPASDAPSHERQRVRGAQATTSPRPPATAAARASRRW